MPPLGTKGKGKIKDGRQSRSRNTTPSSVPSSVVSGPVSTGLLSRTAYLEIPKASLNVLTSTSYDDILERYKAGALPDAQQIVALATDVRSLADAAATRGIICDGGMRELSGRRKKKLEEERAEEQAARDAEEKENLKRAAAEEADARERKMPKIKKKQQKERSRVREERPLTHGAHGLARQDGLVAPPSGPSSPQPTKVQTIPTSSSVASERKPQARSGSSSSLSPASQIHSPVTNLQVQEPTSTRPTPSRNSSNSSLDSHQPVPAPRVVQMQRFGSNPLTSDDPTVYHVRKVAEDMPDEEKREIYGVAQFPSSDLRHLIAGTPPDRDFSNAKPSNQITFNTFNTHMDSYLRPLTEEDMAWLKERGDRVTPFLMPPRGKRHYKEIWAEEDGTVAHDNSQKAKRPANQARGNIDQLNDETAETDLVSVGPVVARLLSLMRPGARIPKEEDKDKAINGLANGTNSNSDPFALNFDDMTMDMDTTTSNDANTLPPATYMPESTHPNWRVPPASTDYVTADENVLANLRYIGFIPHDVQPAYDGHYDDDVAERLRILQKELKDVTIANAARKARMLQVTEVHMAHQEYQTILEDLDAQVTQAYLKRSRSQGKNKKGNKKPGGAGGGSHALGGGAGSSAGVTRPVLGDHAKTLITRRKNWIETISPVFDDVDFSVPSGENCSIFHGEEWEAVLQKERERFEEEAE